MASLAAGYQAAGKLDLTLPLLEETLKLRKAKLGPDHPETLSSMAGIAVGYQAAGKLDLALPLFEETLKLTKAKLGPDHPNTLASMHNLAAGYQAAGKLDLALPLFEEAASGFEKRRFRHELTWPIVSNTIRAYEAAGQYEKAGEWRRKWLGFVKEQSGAESPAYADVLAVWGLGLLERKQWAEAVPVLRECLAIREKTQPDAWTTFNMQSMLGGALLGRKKFADAEPLLVKGYEGMKAREKAIPPQGSTRIPDALDRLVELYTATNKPDEVKKHQELRAKYPMPKEAAPAAKEKK
ncbi:MAG: tetratricopeptide repeat protein [Gemmataceae bacterium]